ncbi:hypothetical protein MTR67_021469 [Solanum verrucosum]|uniref:F-box domain-containing protein n=1 Tax=Solanum verrucosum TaxID=315347 RepID=A0AAF0QY51_SOLVR|nr:hypothetical protein MTR67_021469 [Solanum verrucosum]
MMLPKDKKLCSATLPPDVLRNLPENVLDDILIRVPLRDAVRTSILSKKWRYNWCRLPELTLDQTLWDSTNQSIPFVTRFTDIIYHLLVLHVGPITKFILSDIANLGNYSKIDNLVLFLSRNVVPSPEAGQHYFTKYFESFPTLEHLHLDYHSLQFLAAGSGDIEAKLSSPLNYLKCLCLSYICLDELAELSPALCLIRCSPYLQDIQIKIEYVALNKLRFPVPDDVVNEIPSSFSDVTLNHLRSVKFEGITGKKTEMELVKLLLAKSPMLVRMLIQPDIENGSAETRLKVLTEITKFPRASPKAEVDYNSGV